jgi:hypothetical protein
MYIENIKRIAFIRESISSIEIVITKEIMNNNGKLG